jgi:hypothetical protein
VIQDFNTRNSVLQLQRAEIDYSDNVVQLGGTCNNLLYYQLTQLVANKLSLWYNGIQRFIILEMKSDTKPYH